MEEKLEINHGHTRIYFEEIDNEGDVHIIIQNISTNHIYLTHEEIKQVIEFLQKQL